MATETRTTEDQLHTIEELEATQKRWWLQAPAVGDLVDILHILGDKKLPGWELQHQEVVIRGDIDAEDQLPMQVLVDWRVVYDLREELWIPGKCEATLGYLLSLARAAQDNSEAERLESKRDTLLHDLWLDGEPDANTERA